MNSSEDMVVRVVAIIGFVLVIIVAIYRNAKFSGRVDRAGISVDIEPSTSSAGTREDKDKEIPATPYSVQDRNK
jgi:hypothetical protein